MRSFLLATFAFLTVSPIWADSGDAEQRADQVVSSPIIDLEQVTTDIVPLVVQRLKAQAKDPDQHDTALLNLVMLGDPETIQKTVSQFRAGDAKAASLLKFAGDPSVLPIIAQDMVSGSTYSAQQGTPSQRAQATAIALSILKRATSVPLETSVWAQSVLKDISSGNPASVAKAQDLMQQWWQHNGPLLMAHRDDAAQWLPSQPEPAANAPVPAAASAPISVAPSSASPQMMSTGDRYGGEDGSKPLMFLDTTPAPVFAMTSWGNWNLNSEVYANVVALAVVLLSILGLMSCGLLFLYTKKS